MGTRNPNSEVVDDEQWAERCKYWETGQFNASRVRPRKFKFREPLILCGHGIGIRVDRATLLVRGGFTHFPQDAQEFRYFPGDANLPDKIVVLDGSGQISFDALAWMSNQEIEFLRLDWQGNISSLSGHRGYSANPQIVRAQREIKGTKKEIEIGRTILKTKIANSATTILSAIPKSENREGALAGLEYQVLRLRSTNANSISKLLGIEGEAARIYFSTWHGLPLKWKSIARRPVPNDWAKVGPRTMGWRKRAHTARHPVNAMLNYGYGILKHQVQSQLVTAGFDPTVGILHGNSASNIPLVHDLMEPFRPIVDRCVLEFAFANTFSPADFTITERGGCRLNPQLARSVTELVLKSKIAVRDFDCLIRLPSLKVRWPKLVT